MWLYRTVAEFDMYPFTREGALIEYCVDEVYIHFFADTNRIIVLIFFHYNGGDNGAS